MVDPIVTTMLSSFGKNHARVLHRLVGFQHAKIECPIYRPHARSRFPDPLSSNRRPGDLNSLTTVRDVLNTLAVQISASVPQPPHTQLKSSSSRSRQNEIELRPLPDLRLPSNVSNLDINIKLNGIADYQQMADHYLTRNSTGSGFWLSLSFLTSPGFFALLGNYQKQPDDGTEGWVERYLVYSADRVLLLVILEILDVWHKEPNISQTDFQVMMEILQNLSLTSQRFRNCFQPDLRFLYKDETMSSMGAKSTGISTKSYKNPTQNGAKTKDTYLSDLVDGKAKLTDHVQGWMAETHLLVAQMYNYAVNTTTGLSFFTSVFGFTRIGSAKQDAFYLSENLAKYTADSEELRRSEKTYSPFVHELHRFLLYSLITAKPQVLPPSKREGVVTVSHPNSAPPGFSHQAHIKVSHSVVGLCPRIMRFMSRFTVSSIGGSFKNLDDGFLSCQLSLQLPCPTPRSATCVSIHPQLGLVLKGFYEEEMFKREYKAYTIMENKIPGVPKFYGAFWNTWSEMYWIAVEFVGHTLDQENIGTLNMVDWLQVREIISDLHQANIHHHDLYFNNVARRKDGKLYIIDFGNVDLEFDCTGKGCPDQQWLYSVHPSNSLSETAVEHKPSSMNEVA
ncbi:hypothetical protein E1B28_011189 [Marasmius oreades]|uniref:Protein kinase domain-containing protein n=1 Tax=Marasmius oreades TaxID=181124 RepID=A0A9P7RU74_9AGAR|nr:uncharacterized protein E1B28_011189 [Marasmius oreades]KAG7089513.1 hypothetical protein E1B28_011189 [Marasmius oreades]